MLIHIDGKTYDSRETPFGLSMTPSEQAWFARHVETMADDCRVFAHFPLKLEPGTPEFKAADKATDDMRAEYYAGTESDEWKPLAPHGD